MDFAKEIETALTQRIGAERYELWFADVQMSQHASTIRVASATQFSSSVQRLPWPSQQETLSFPSPHSPAP